MTIRAARAKPGRAKAAEPGVVMPPLRPRPSAMLGGLRLGLTLGAGLILLALVIAMLAAPGPVVMPGTGSGDERIAGESGRP